MKIDLNAITPKQKLVISKGLCDYQYIMNNWEQDDADFRDVYYEFYLKARWAVMKKDGNRLPYFDKLQQISQDDNLMDILEELKEKMESGSYELSVGSKLLHTRNSAFPIYDSKVREYLMNNEGVEFWWNVSGTSRPPRTPKKEQIRHDWEMLCDWYREFLSSDRGRRWVEWFDDNFSTYKHISDVKKIDFIIFATN